MLAAPVTESRTTSALTCWKCGQDTLKEAAGATESFSSKGEKVMSTARRHSDCQNCGAYSVDADQARYNKAIDKKNRRAHIRDTNRRTK